MLEGFETNADALVLYAVPPIHSAKGAQAAITVWCNLQYNAIPEDKLCRLRRRLAADEHLLQPDSKNRLHLSILGHIESADHHRLTALSLSGMLLFTLGIKAALVELPSIEHVIKAIAA